jgi:hypothetical protein
MIKYIMTSKSFTGTVIFGFEGDVMTFYHNEAEMSTSQVNWLFRHFPFNMELLEQFRKITQSRLDLVPVNITFDAFWNTYGKKINKKRCQPLWKKMSEADRIECLMSIKAYDTYLRRANRAKLDPENYLKRESYKNNWNQLN